MWLIRNDQRIICSDPLQEHRYKWEISIKGIAQHSAGLDYISKGFNTRCVREPFPSTLYFSSGNFHM